MMKYGWIVFDERWMNDEWYMMDEEKRRECGMKGHEFVKRDDVMMTSKHMCDNFIDHMEKVFSVWKPRKRFTIYKA